MYFIDLDASRCRKTKFATIYPMMYLPQMAILSMIIPLFNVGNFETGPEPEPHRCRGELGAEQAAPFR